MDTALPPRKRLFVALMGVTCLLIVGLIYLMWWIPTKGLANFHPDLPRIVGLTFAGLSLLAVLGTGLLVLTTALGKDIFFTRFMRLVVIKFLLPAIEMLGRAIGIHKDHIRQSFVAMNNSLVTSQKLLIPADRILILLPHCLQLFDCDIKVTGGIDKCARCGRCNIMGLAELGEKYKIDISVATGGTLARKVIVEKRPKLVVAVACERDLTSGIKDCYPLPVIGVLNERPKGPCIDTIVDVAKIDAAIASVIS
ncbi:DUF116 domain-containing protein [Geobacter pelophilus]|jgi:hypothetical protein|uniref:DUF116 domain-containing protein n=1 Tax=Geoanaerobacter pelophilus TaxID=60036 RepID=A0AAW4L399_9BACT|nr:DUF116 domain-containing protein [Geoanaerobacter pelophilus]MBT0665353.1 DUF116 domain-containing protein [Geoanaerobacter pelophilus]